MGMVLFIRHKSYGLLCVFVDTYRAVPRKLRVSVVIRD